jgi:hypothetical protein
LDVNSRRRLGAALGLMLLLTAVLLVYGRSGDRPVSPLPTITPEPLVPTRTPSALSEVSGQVVVTETAVPSPTPVLTSEARPTQGVVPVTAVAPILPASDLARFGVTGGQMSAAQARQAGLPYGSLLSWNISPAPEGGPAEFWQLVRLNEDGIRRTTWADIEQTIAANPGSFWIVGNEPDVKWQDNVTPERYAEHYHELYNFIKSRDPEANLVIGGVSQPTPLRRAYLDRVLDTYETLYGEPLPVDVWNVHAFVLREEAGSWGVDIPPGMEVEEGALYELADHDNLDILQQNLFDFRAWMAERGYGDRPLVVSEYGILMPEDYGFPLERVGAFLTGTFDIFRTIANETGYAADDGRLVQWWFWYSVYDGELYPTGNLWDSERQELTPLGNIWMDYVNAIAPS